MPKNTKPVMYLATVKEVVVEEVEVEMKTSKILRELSPNCWLVWLQTLSGSLRGTKLTGKD